VTGLARADGEVPSFARFKPTVADVEHKDDGSFFSGLPLVGYDTNTGLGLGLGGYYTMNGARTDDLFPVTPYRNRFFVQGYATTGGYQQHLISYDGVYIGHTPYRVRATVMFERNTNANYFGVGESTLQPLSFRGQTHATYDAQLAAASAIDANGMASPYYNHYEYDKPSATVSVERDFWGGRVRAHYGFVSQYVSVSKYDDQLTTGVSSAGQSIPAYEAPTLLGMDCAKNAILGCGGGWNNMLKAGLVLDTRDFEPDPTSGFFIDATGEWSDKAFGASFDYLRFTLAARAYWSPFPKLTNLVVAARLLYSMQTSGVPFFAANTLALTEDDQTGLGGERTLRGYRQDRFIGAVSALGNLELRWTFVHFKLLKQTFSIQAAPFFDVGRVFDNVVDGLAAPCSGAFDCWKVSGGGGIRIGWNRSTIIMFDLGASAEDIGFYIDFGMPF
jgi:outer membrane protein assembly factor BamA